MANKTEFIRQVQNHAGVTYVMVQRWKELIAEHKFLGYDGVPLPDTEVPNPNIITDEQIAEAALGDPFNAATFLGLMAGAEGLAELLESSGNLAAMCKIKT